MNRYDEAGYMQTSICGDNIDYRQSRSSFAIRDTRCFGPGSTFQYGEFSSTSFLLSQNTVSSAVDIHFNGNMGADGSGHRDSFDFEITAPSGRALRVLCTRLCDAGDPSVNMMMVHARDVSPGSSVTTDGNSDNQARPCHRDAFGDNRY